MPQGIQPQHPPGQPLLFGKGFQIQLLCLPPQAGIGMKVNLLHAIYRSYISFVWVIVRHPREKGNGCCGKKAAVIK
jgi:hypothetical protein